MIEIRTIGGYNEVGKNCTVLIVDDEAVILDMGIYLEKYIKYTEDEDIRVINRKELIEVGAVPDLRKIHDITKKVKAIIPTHPHLDHIGAIPFFANQYDCPIIGTPYSIEVLRVMLESEKIKLPNRLIALNPNSSLKLTEKITIEFVYITHSIPQTVIIAVHTPYGTVVYSNDFKFDSTPVLGKKPNIKRLKELGKEGVKALICESTYADYSMKTPSEGVAKEMLKEIMLGVESNGLIIATTFSSHIARLKSIVEFSKTLNRKVVFLGRSLAKYALAAERVGIIKFSNEVEIVRFSKNIQKKLNEVSKNPNKYVLVVTGHQGEPKAVLTKIVNGQLKYSFKADDIVIFSCRVIPSPLNIADRKELEELLINKRIRMFKDIHTSGHAAREDLRDMLNMLKPKNLIPAHGDIEMTTSFGELAEQMGYVNGENLHISRDGNRIYLN